MSLVLDLVGRTAGSLVLDYDSQVSGTFRLDDHGKKFCCEQHFASIMNG